MCRVASFSGKLGIILDEFLQFSENVKRIFGEFGKMHIVNAVLRYLPMCTTTLAALEYFALDPATFHEDVFLY